MKRFALALILTLVSCTAAFAQETPRLTERAAQVIDALVPMFPGGKPGGTDDQRRELTKAIIEQLVCEFPNDGYTWKSADPGRPPSKDAIGRKVGERLYIWDWQNGTTRARQIKVGDAAHDITGQNPISVGCVNRLGGTTPPPPPPPVDPDGDLRVRVIELENVVERLQRFAEEAMKLMQLQNEAINRQQQELNELRAADVDLYNLSDSRCVNGRVAGVFGVRSCPEPRR